MTGDVDGDGDADFFVADRTAEPSLYLYTRVAGGWNRSVVDPANLKIEAGGAMADIDQDGDLDLVFGQDGSGVGDVWWWENPLPDLPVTAEWTRRLIKTGGRQGHDQGFGDFDNDGDLEFVTWVNQDNRVEIYEIPEDPTLSPWNLGATVNMAGEGIFIVDVDLDGIADILAGQKWIRHEGAGQYATYDIDPAYPSVSSRIAGGQFIPGGRPEVVISSGDADGPLNFYQYDGANWIRTTLIEQMVHGHSLEVGDIDLDGNLDFFAAEMGNPGAGANCTAWIGWGDGLGGFELEILSVGIANHESRLADLDDDGDLDIVSKPYNFGAPEVGVFLNEGLNHALSLDDWERHSIDPAMPWQPILVTAGDINGDGLLDIISGGWWYTNPGTIDGVWVRNEIGGQLKNMAWVHDFDGDGDLDVFGTDGQPDGGNFGWAGNDGFGSFTYHDNVDFGEDNFFQGALGASFTSGAPYQIVIQWNDGENGNSEVDAFSVPTDPVNEQWVKSILNTNSFGEDMNADDIDGDGDLDIFQGRSWLRNEDDETWSFFEIATFPPEYGGPDRNKLEDIDGDGDRDAVVGLSHFSGNDTVLLWLEHPADPTATWPIHIITSGVWGGYSLDAADIDYDGDIDVVLGEHRGATRALIYENIDGGDTWAQHMVDPGGAGIDNHNGTKLFDLDEDGDLDIVSIGWDNDKLWVFENQTPVAPDFEPPTTPDGLTVTPLLGPTIRVSWSPSTDNQAVAAYRIYRDGQLIATVEEPNFLDVDVADNTPYSYSVTAVDGIGNVSEPSTAAGTTSFSTTDFWWDPIWRYRVLLTVDPAGVPRTDSVVDLEIDFAQLLANETNPAAIDTGSLRIVEVRENGEILNASVPVQFDPKTATQGTLIFALAGPTAGDSPRLFHLYFATEFSGAIPLDFEPHIAVEDDVMDEGQSSFKFTTLSGDLTFHKSGGGFSSWDDIDGNDWIGYEPTGGSSGNFRGIPNLVYPEGHFHPGSTTAVSTLEHSGPLKATIRSDTNDGEWECLWEIYGEFARMTVLKAPKEYWFLYEGTPGGSLDPLSDKIVRSNGSASFASESWLGDLPGDEWVYFTDASTNRSLFMALRQADTDVDSYRPLDGAMTVFGFGRNLGVGSFLSGVPKTFTMGLAEGTGYQSTKALIESAYKDLLITTSALNRSPDVEPPSAPTNPRIDGISTDSIQFSWDESTDNVFVFGYRIYRSDESGGPIGTSAGESYEDSGLQPNTTYTYLITALDGSSNESAPSAALQATTASENQLPSTPAGLAATALSETQISLSWNPSTDDGFVSEYQIFRDSEMVGTSQTTTFLDSNLNADSVYQYAVRALDNDLFVSGFSETIEVRTLPDTTPPSTPQDLTVTGAGLDSLQLSWTPSTDNYALGGYRINRDGSFLAEVTGTSFSDDGLDPNTAYSYTVEAFDTSGNSSGLAGPATGTTLPDVDAPTPPGNLQAGIPNENGVSLSWTASVDNVAVAFYRVLRDNLQLADVVTTSHFDNGAIPGEIHRYRVVAFDAAGNVSDSSNLVIVQGGAPPPPPPSQNLVTNGGFESGTSSWQFYTNASGNAVATGPGFTGSSAIRVTTTTIGSNIQLFQPNLSLEPNTDYRLTFAAYSNTGRDLRVSMAKHGAPYTNYGMNRVQADLTSNWQTFTINFRTSGFNSNVQDARLSFWFSTDAQPGDQYFLDDIVLAKPSAVVPPDTENPSTPTGLAPVFVSDSEAQLSWNGSNDNVGVLGYLIFRDGTDVGISTATSHLDTELDPLTSYAFTVAAFDRAGNVSAASNPIVVNTPAPAQAPSVPQNLQAAGLSLSQISLTWDPSTDDGFVAEYRIFRDSDLAGTSSIGSFTDSGLNPGSTHQYTVQAVDNEQNVSSMSDPVPGTTLPDDESPSTPQNLQAAASGGTAVALSWGAATDNVGVTFYRIFRDDAPLADVTVPAHLDETVAPETTYGYRVVAFDAAGNPSGSSDLVNVLTGAANPPPPPPPQNLLSNGGFESGMSSWTFYTNGSGSAIAAGPGFTGSNATLVTTNTAGSNIQLFQQGIPLEPNTDYRLSFAAYSNSGRDLRVSIAQHGTPFTNYGMNRVRSDLTSNWQTFTINFTTTGFSSPVNDGRLFFWFATDAQSGDRYYLDEISFAPATPETPDALAPGSPSGLVAVAVSSSASQLSWNGSTDNVGVLGYLIYRDGTDAGSSATTSFNDPGLSPSTNYSYAVTAFDAAGNESAPSNSADVTTPAPSQPPTTPQSLLATALSETQISLSWDPSTDDGVVTEYRIFRDSNMVGTTTAVAFEDSALSADSSYQYTVQAVDNEQNVSSMSDPVTGTTLPDNEPPSTPQNLQAVVSGGTAVALSWEAATDNVSVTFYRVFRDDAPLADVTAPAHLDGTVAPETNYDYRVVAFDAAGNPSGSSDIVNVLTGAANPPPPPPQNLVTNGGFESGMSSWTFYTNGSGSAVAAGPGFTGSNAALVTTSTAGSNIQLFQSGIPLEPNTDYRLSFAAYSSTGNDLRVSMGQHGAPYTNYGMNRLRSNLTTTWQTFTVDFTTTGFSSPVNDGRLFFWFANDAQPGDRYFIDQVVLSER